MKSYSACKDFSRAEEVADGDPSAVLKSGAIQDSRKDQNQRREILRTVSNKLKNELAMAFQNGHLSKSEALPERQKQWQEGCEAKKTARDGPQLPETNSMDVEVQEAITNGDRATSPSPTLTEISDYTMSSVSVDDQGPEHASEVPCSSFNEGLGQWDLLEDASHGTALVSTAGGAGDWNKGCQVEASDGVVSWPSAKPLSEDRTCTCSGASTGNYAGSTKNPKTRPSPLGCPSGEEDQSISAREDFDIVYDVFYQDDGFEPFDAFIGAEDAVTEELRVLGNRHQCPNSGSATPPLERVDSPEFSVRSRVKSLPSMSTCRSEAEEFMTYSCQGLRRLPATFAPKEEKEEEEFLSFSRRDLVVLRRSLRSLQVGPGCLDVANGLPDGADHIQEDLTPAGEGELTGEEEGGVIQGGHEQENGVGRFVACHEMFTSKERKVRPLSAARVRGLLSNSLGLGIRQPRSDDGKEISEMKSEFVPLGAQNGENLIRENLPGQVCEMTSGFSSRHGVHHCDPGSRESSHGSSYATPRTGISTEESEFSETAKRVPSRPEVCEVPAEGSILELLSAKVQMLDLTQQKYLLQVLSKIERAKMIGNLNIPTMLASLEQPRIGVPLTSPEVEGAPKATVLIIRFLSTWGDTKSVGLVEANTDRKVDLFDNAGRKVELQSSNVSLHGNTCWDTGANEILPRIINGIVSTTRDRHMWLCPLPPPGCSPLEIHIQVPSPDTILGHLRIWNYNRSINDIAKGAKEIQVYVDRQLVWQGVVAKGCGNQVFEYSTRIPLLDETPTSVTASSTQSRTGCTVQDVHSTASAPQANCKVHPCSSREIPGGAPISVGTSFTFSPIDGSSGSSICGILSCPSSASGDHGLPTAVSLVDVGANEEGSVDENCLATVDNGRHQLNARDYPVPPHALGQCPKLDTGRYQGEMENSYPDANSLPIWLAGSSTKEDDAAELQKQDLAGSSEAVADCNLLDQLGMTDDGALSQLPSPAEFRGLKLTVGRRNPNVTPKDTNGSLMNGGVQHKESHGGEGSLQTVDNQGEGGLVSSEGKTGRHVLVQRVERNEESGAVSAMGSPRKQRLLHSAFSGLRKVVVRLKLGLRLASKVEPSGKESVVDDLSFNTTTNSLVPNSGVGRPRFLLGLSSKSLSLLSQPPPKRQPEVATTAAAAVGEATQEEEAEAIEHFETPGVMERRKEVLESWDSLVQFKAAQMADAQFYSSFISCQQMYDSATQSAHFFSLGSDGADSPPCSSNPHLTEMIYRTRMELENLRCRGGDTLCNPYDDQFDVGHGFPLDFDDAELQRLDEETSDFDISGDDEGTFTIPVLPCGQVLIVNILSTWGDPHYVGLAGIELFDGNGQLIELCDPLEQVQADPPDVNILPGYKNDPRTVDKLVDNVNMTCDDYHVWLAPFTAGQPHLIKITLNSPTSLGMLRFWNYNKSRIHSYRGARMVEITFDRKLIFIGELGKASGSLIDAAQRAEPILFTTSEEVLSAIEQYDQRYQRESVLAQESAVIPPPRPSTSGRHPADVLHDTTVQYPAALTNGAAERPPTHAIRSKSCMVKDAKVCSLDLDRVDWLHEQGMADGRKKRQDQFLVGEVLKLRILGTWGDPHYVGLTGIQVKWLQLLVDDFEVFPFGSELVRKAPGTDIFDFGHVMPLPSPGQTKFKSSQAESLTEKLKVRERANRKRSHNDFIRQEFETPLLPCGHIIKVVLRSTWGDQHYVGLNGLELYDEAGRLLPLSKYNVYSNPSSINELPGVSDVRTLDKLFDGINNTWDDRHMWLTLYEPGRSNQIYVVFEDPVMLSVLRVWNYSKTPARGASDFEVFIDDLLIYKGYLKKAPSLTAINRAMTDFSQSVIFTNDETMVQTHKSRVYFRGDIAHTDVVLVNEKHIESSARPSQQSVLESRPRPPTGLSVLRRN